VKLRDYQIEAVESIWSYFAENDGHPLLVLPTASGKSVIQAEIIRRIMVHEEDRILCLTHVKELIQQNHDKLKDHWPSAPAGVYAASLKRREAFMPIVFASIQTVYRRAEELGKFSLIIIDECHLVPMRGNTMYREFLRDMQTINPKVKIIGMSATPYRLDHGYLHKGPDRIFTDIAFDLSVAALIDQGYLSPVRAVGSQRQINLDGVRTRQGEYVAADLEAAVHEEGLTEAAVAEIIAAGEGRKSWLIFAPTVDYAYEVRDHLIEAGIKAATIEAKTPQYYRDEIVEKFKSGQIRALTNVSVLTTGFDAPQVDLLVMLRPTQSTSLYVQMVGRGMRLAPGKEDCLILDFSGNVIRHGPVDAVVVREKSEEDDDVKKDAPKGKKCPRCSTITHPRALVCDVCGYIWPPKHDAKPSEAPVLASHRKSEWLRVTAVHYRRHRKTDKPDSLRVDYVCGLRIISEYVCLEHVGFAQAKAQAWVDARNATGAEIRTVGDALRWSHKLRTPIEIMVKPDGKWDRVAGYRFDASQAGADSVGASAARA
jgi:DNA repair protein RadD